VWHAEDFRVRLASATTLSAVGITLSLPGAFSASVAGLQAVLVYGMFLLGLLVTMYGAWEMLKMRKSGSWGSWEWVWRGSVIWVNRVFAFGSCGGYSVVHVGVIYGSCG
jgi:hypothetical protein